MGRDLYDYYLVSFRLTNHSQRPVDLDEYTFEAVPQKGDEWAARFDSEWDSEAAYTLRPQVPQGCTAPVSMVLRVDPEELKSRTLDVFFEDYAGGIPWGRSPCRNELQSGLCHRGQRPLFAPQKILSSFIFSSYQEDML